MKKFKFLIGVGLVVGAAILWFVQEQAALQLREENNSLRQQLQQMTQVQTDNERLSDLVAQANNRLPNEQFTELLKLRGEVGLLRQQTNALQKLHEQNQQLQTALSQKNPQNLPVANSPATAPPLAVYPRSSWTFAGYATPEAAFQSMNWAAAQGDLNVFLNGSTPDQQKDFANEFLNKSESDISDEIKKAITRNTEVSILGKEVRSDNEVVLTIAGDAKDSGGNTSVANLVFQKINGQWKYASEIH